jgi:hypothetical protein
MKLSLLPRLFPALGILALSITGAVPANAADSELQFDVRLLTVDGNEGIAAGDFDGDGKLDLAAGRNWFRNGDWAARPVRNIDDWNGYVESNGDYAMDVDQDGRLDIIAGSFLPTKVHWYQNPGDEGLRLGKQWPEHLLVDTGAKANEGQLLEDIDGDGTPEWIVNSWQPQNPMVIWRFEPAESRDDAGKSADAGQPLVAFEVKRHELGPVNGHGVAVGDLNGDGLKDVLIGHGWYEQPADGPWSGPWKLHEDWKLHSSLPMIVTDLDADGDNDLIFGNGHAYGLQWWEQTGVDGDGKIQWTEHAIDKRFSQPHCLLWKDLDGDGDPDLITGKRYYAHNGKDPGGQEVPCLYWYDWDAEAKTFTRHTIDEGQIGTGLQIIVEDFNGDGAMDIAVAGKSGTYLLTAKK